ncbi:hypothetical protein [Sphingobium sp. YR768]|uniref:hypothetical protein n=1 Tax=Sphingobium sp. YR768 TaxID=1884365 RepID=UPI0008B73CCC|nr:hypothetical protein [Sphingobium sp. YR768]SES08665.1 hypothetical protein SAMN05518866_13745 [Sphingobium sp. YR768]
MSHVNLFQNGNNAEEVYDSLLRDQKRDFQKIATLDLIAGFSVLAAVANFHGYREWFIAAAAIFGFWSIRYFIDVTVRNYYLHRLDWDAALEVERQQPFR